MGESLIQSAGLIDHDHHLVAVSGSVGIVTADIIDDHCPFNWFCLFSSPSEVISLAIM